MKWHPSSIGKIMTNARSKSEILSETAKSYIKSVAKQDFFGYNVDLNNKYVIKGQEQEQDSINLLNAVRMTSYVKNDKRLINDIMTGECDILLDDHIIDIKTSWSLETFPALAEDGMNKDYEWQLRAYMYLYDRPTSELIYCMVTTNDDLLSQWDNLSLHRVDHIDPDKRITVIPFERDQDLESQMIDKLDAASELYVNYVNQLNNK
jgi:hypothetical protein